MNIKYLKVFLYWPLFFMLYSLTMIGFMMWQENPWQISNPNYIYFHIFCYLFQVTVFIYSVHMLRLKTEENS